MLKFGYRLFEELYHSIQVRIQKSDLQLVEIKRLKRNYLKVFMRFVLMLQVHLDVVDY